MIHLSTQSSCNILQKNNPRIIRSAVNTRIELAIVMTDLTLAIVTTTSMFVTKTTKDMSLSMMECFGPHGIDVFTKVKK